MTTSTEHTPGRLTWNGRFAGEHDESGATIRAADGSFFASTYGGLTYNSTPEEWARYRAAPAELVRRWNAFEEGGAVAALVTALEAITTHTIERVSRTPEEVAESDACPECQRFRAQSWPPLGLCSTHEHVYYRYVRENEHREKYHDGDLRQIARAALAAVRGEG